jgi:hypothetical protein
MMVFLAADILCFCCILDRKLAFIAHQEAYRKRGTSLSSRKLARVWLTAAIWPKIK